MLTQSEADALIAMQKTPANEGEVYYFPLPGETLTIPIVSLDKVESFLMDINRGTIRLSKCTYQERYQGIIILVHLDINGSPHPNPEAIDILFPYLEPYNGHTIPCTHLHLYIEGFMDKWAIPVSPEEFPKTDDIYETLWDFFRYCNLIELPLIQRSMR